MQAFIANDPNAANQIQQTMRLRDEPPPITQPTSRGSRKRKSPPTNTTQPDTQPPPPPQQQQPPPPQPPMHPGLPPMIVHGLPPGAPIPYYHHADFTPGGLPPPNSQQPPDQQQSQSQQGGAGGRVLSSSKRAEQNRKAQRAFRERRDQHVKALESRSQLLDAALASADEANRRWEECRGLLDQLRVENAALRAALSQSQLLPPGTTLPPPPGSHLPPPHGPPQDQQPLHPEGPNGVQSEDASSATENKSNELNKDSAAEPSDGKKE